MDKVLFKKMSPMAKVPVYQTPGSAGVDVASIEEVELKPGEVRAIRLGFAVAVPEGYELQVRSRSGIALKNKIAVLNAPGTIDSDFRDECKVILMNFGTETFVIKPGHRVAQFVLNKVERITFQETDTLPETERTGGFGSTGV